MGCGQCLDLAYEGNTADFSFVYCKENLKRFEIAQDNGETEYIYASDIPAMTSNETLESVRTYDSVDSTAFQRSYVEEWFGTKRKVNYVSTAITFVVLFAMCACCCGAGALYLFASESKEASWSGSGILMVVNLFIWMTTVISTANVEIMQPEMFGDLECLIVDIGYAFYRTVLVLNMILFFLGIWMWILNFCGNNNRDSSNGNEVVMCCQLLSLCTFAILWVGLTIMSFIILDQVGFTGQYNSWLIGLGAACGVVCCVVFVYVPLSLKVDNAEEGGRNPYDIMMDIRTV